jgi:hypothetical protein
MIVTEGKARAFRAIFALIHDEQMLRADSVIGAISPKPENNGYDKRTRILQLNCNFISNGF